MANEDALVVRPNPETQNVLAPVRAVAGRLGPFHVLDYTAVKIDPQTESYKPQQASANERALLKPALMKLAAAAGMTVLFSGPVPGTQVTTDHLMWQVTMSMPLGEGETIERTGTWEWDAAVQLDGLEQKPKDALQVRKNRVMMAESKAMNRAIRSLLAVRSKYTVQELAKPFVIPRVRYEPNLDDPNVMQIVQARGSVAAKSLYGNTPDAPALPAGDPDADYDEAEAARAMAAGSDDPFPEDAGAPEVVDEFDEGPVAHPDTADIGDWVMDTNGRSKFDGMTLRQIDEEHSSYWAYIYPKLSGKSDEELGDWAAFYHALCAYLDAYNPQLLRDMEEGA